MSKSGSKVKRRSRVEAADAREFAGRVHSSESPVLFREYVSRAEANSRCWEWNKARPVFSGLGVEFLWGRWMSLIVLVGGVCLVVVLGVRRMLWWSRRSLVRC